MGLFIAMIGGAMVGAALMSFSLKAKGLADVRLWAGLIGLLLAGAGVTMNACGT